MSYLTKKQLISAKGMCLWTYPRLHKGLQWYVDFYCYDPGKGCMRRKKYMLDRYRGVRARETMASQIVHELVSRLQMGWNPFVNAKRSREYTRWEVVAGRYRDYLKVSVRKGLLRAKTAYDYESRLRQLELYLDETDARLECVYEFDGGFVNDYLDYLLLDKDVSARTRNNHRTWLSTLGGWLVEKQYLSQNPVEGTSPLREAEKLREPLSAGMLKQLHDYLAKTNRPFLLACMLVYYAAIRPEELRNLRIRDISISEQTVTVPADVAKNHRAQAVGLHDRILRLMIELRLFDHPGHEYIFGNNLCPSEERTYINRFRIEWHKVRRALGWGMEYQFYSLKDSGIRDMITALGAVVARDQARHSDISVTNLYVKRGRRPDEGTKHFDGEL